MQACKFTLSHYKSILKTGLRKGYSFIGFGDKAIGRTCILRHDIDYFPEGAMDFAEIESGLGIKAAYFFQLSAQTYNLLSFENMETVFGLKALGHEVGVHVDLLGVEDIPLFCSQQRSLFGRLFGFTPSSFVSFHNPLQEVLGFKIGFTRHTYEPEFFSEMKYLSDSRGWNNECVCKVFSKRLYNNIQLLTHPYIWTGFGCGDFIENISALVDFRKRELVDYFLRFHPTVLENRKRFLKGV